MARPPSLISKVKDFFAKDTKPVPGGAVYSPSVARRKRRLALPFDEPIVRLILGDEGLTRDLCEIAAWSPEAIGAVNFLSNDPFQQAGGQTGSWSVSKTKDGKEGGPRTHPDVLAIGQEVANRFDGKESVIGGDRLQSPIRNALFFGDGYSELEISRDGLGSYLISKLVDHPSLQVFGCLGNREYYELISEKQFNSAQDAIEVPWWKMLHFSYQGRVGRYGTPLFQAQVDRAWRPLKSVAEDALDVIRASGTAPWVHSFGPDMDENAQEAYRLKIEEERDVRILTDLFVGNGGSVQRAGGSESAIAGIMGALEQYRTQMIPPGFPAYLFPGIKGGDASKDLSAQPALAYARKVEGLRSLIGQQVRWAIALEIVLKKGYDFYTKEGQFEIEWPFWMISGLESPQMQGRQEAQQQQEQTQRRLDQMMGSLEARYQNLIDLDNVGKVIDEVVKRDGRH